MHEVDDGLAVWLAGWMALSNLHPAFEPIVDLFEAAQSELEKRGFVAQIATHSSLANADGDLGLRIDAHPRDANDPRKWSLSVDVDVDASNLVTLLVDGVANEEVSDEATFPMPSDLEEKMQHVIDWFTSQHVPPA